MPLVPASGATPAPAPAAPVPAGGLSVPGTALAVAVGQTLAARVLETTPGAVRLAIAGGHMTAATDLPLQPGATLRMTVADVRDGRVLLSPVPGAPAGQAAAAGQAAGDAAAQALRAAGVPGRVATALVAAFAQSGVPVDAAQAGALAARAGAAGVGTPAQATAFARLAVAGLATLLDGAPIGRALAAVVEGARAAPAPASGPPAAAIGAGASTPSPRGATAPPGTAPAAGTPAAPAAPTAAAARPAPATPVPTGSPAPAPVPGGGAGTAAVAPGIAPPDLPVGTRALGDALAQALHRVAGASVSGDGAALRAAVAELGTGLEGRLLSGAAPAPQEATVRTLLTALATGVASDPALARAASSLADAIGAQPLAGHTAAPGSGTPPSAHAGAYIQLPLPGGGTAEVRVDRDGAGGGEAGGERRVAMLLNLSALGPVMITATAGDGPVDARVRAGDEAARAFLAGHTGELLAALASGDAPARVRVEAAARPTPERLLAPPPSTGVDRHA